MTIEEKYEIALKALKEISLSLYGRRIAYPPEINYHFWWDVPDWQIAKDVLKELDEPAPERMCAKCCNKRNGCDYCKDGKPWKMFFIYR